MKFAFIIMGGFDSKTDRADIRGGEAQIIGVSSVQEACDAASVLKAQGVGCIELCGAFGEEGARAVIDATGNSVPVGYVCHLPEQDILFAEAFGEGK